MAREYLMILEETSYGTPNLTTGAPTSGKNSYIRLDGGNNFGMRAVRQTFEIPYGGGFNVPAIRSGYPVASAGPWNTILHYSQAARILGWGITRINSGRDAPWTTTDSGDVMQVGDLASLSFYHGFQYSDETYKRRGFRGVKPARMRLEGNAQTQLMRLSCDLIGQKPDDDDAFGGSDSSGPNATEFPFPADAGTDYPTDPVLFQHLSGGLTIGSSRTLFESFFLEITNNLDPKHWEGRFLSSLNCYGRRVTIGLEMKLKASPDNREAFEALTAQDTSVVFTNGVTTITFDLNTKCQFVGLDDDFPLDQTYRERGTVLCLWDTSTGADISVAVS